MRFAAIPRNHIAVSGRLRTKVFVVSALAWIAIAVVVIAGLTLLVRTAWRAMLDVFRHGRQG